MLFLATAATAHPKNKSRGTVAMLSKKPNKTTEMRKKNWPKTNFFPIFGDIAYFSQKAILLLFYALVYTHTLRAEARAQEVENRRNPATINGYTLLWFKQTHTIEYPIFTDIHNKNSQLRLCHTANTLLFRSVSQSTNIAHGSPKLYPAKMKKTNSTQHRAHNWCIRIELRH